MTAMIKALLDVALTAGFLVLMEPNATGLSLHEWGGLAIGVFFLIHKILNYKWFTSVVPRLFSRGLALRQKLNFVLDMLLFVAITLIILSGMGIARTIDFTWLMGRSVSSLWRGMHLVASLFMLGAAGIHLGLHWDWIVCQVRKIGRKKECAHEVDV